MKRTMAILLMAVLLLLPALSLAETLLIGYDRIYDCFDDNIEEDNLIVAVRKRDGGGGGGGTMRNRSGGRVQLRVAVHNNDESRTVASFQLYAFATDHNDELLWGEDRVYTESTKKKIKPGSYGYASYMTFPDKNLISRLWVGVKSATFTDGTTVEYDLVNFFPYLLAD